MVQETPIPDLATLDPSDPDTLQAFLDDPDLFEILEKQQRILDAKLLAALTQASLKAARRLDEVLDSTSDPVELRRIANSIARLTASCARRPAATTRASSGAAPPSSSPLHPQTSSAVHHSPSRGISIAPLAPLAPLAPATRVEPGDPDPYHPHAPRPTALTKLLTPLPETPPEHIAPLQLHTLRLAKTPQAAISALYDTLDVPLKCEKPVSLRAALEASPALFDPSLPCSFTRLDPPPRPPKIPTFGSYDHLFHPDDPPPQHAAIEIAFPNSSFPPCIFHYIAHPSDRPVASRSWCLSAITQGPAG